MAKVYGTKARDGGATCAACEIKVAAGQPIIKVSQAAGVVRLYCPECGNKARATVEAKIADMVAAELANLEPQPIELVAIPECIEAAFTAATEGGL